jgi:putative chitinase
MIALSAKDLSARWPHAGHSLVDGMAAASESAFAKYGLTTVQEVADFMAQISEETGGGTAIEENLNYTAARLCQVWPSRFPTLAAAMPYQHNPRALADNVYGGRMGNIGVDDGYTYRGRGLIQITGREWYRKLATATGLDLIGNPALANDPAHALEVACAFWKLDGVNGFADAGNFREETVRINGGLTNYPLRLQWRAIWRREFSLAA